MKDPRDVILEPVVSEKSYDLIQDLNTYTFIVDRRSNKTEIKQAVADASSTCKVVSREHDEPQGQAQADRMGDREAQRAPSAPWCALPPATRSTSSRYSDMGVKKLKPTSPGRRFQTVSDFESITKEKPEK